MKHVNKVTIIGKITSSPKIRDNNHKLISNFEVSTTDKWFNTRDNKEQEKTVIHNVTFWGNLAKQINENIQLNDLVYIEGKLQNTYFEKDGTKHMLMEIIGSSYINLNNEHKD